MRCRRWFRHRVPGDEDLLRMDSVLGITIVKVSDQLMASAD